MWIYSQATGELSRDGKVKCTGYAGCGQGKNNPLMEAMSNVGPIPRGRYEIGRPFTHPKCGPYCIPLTPLPQTHTFGRSGFLIHGDSIEEPGTASEGCIVAPRPNRVEVIVSGDRLLEVV